MNGVLLVDKPQGPTSHDVVGRVRRALGTRRIGHTGTLDPLATGLLPLVVGQATRLTQFLTRDDKEYVADVRFGASTATYDADDGRRPPDAADDGRGVVADANIPRDVVERALEGFRGSYLQTPPPFSAKKIDGTPAYRLARRGKDVELKQVTVTVSALEVVSYAPDRVRVRIACSSGFYVRVLAHELGQRLGCGGYLEGLRRVRAGAFSLTDATRLDVIEAEGLHAARRLIPLDQLLPSMPSVVLSEEGVKRVRHGNAIAAHHFRLESMDAAIVGPDIGQKARVRLMDASGSLLAIAAPEADGALHPVVVLV
jgi:tRNA pseudouridine55 synthase